MQDAPVLKLSAQIAYTFHIDPLQVMKANRFEWAARIAAYRHIQKIEAEKAVEAKAEAERQKNQSSAKYKRP